MSRAKATALVLVNWKGVFFERYLLDRRVTALEGANGAGKTTVMIAAYVVLLPDLSRLRFTNVGETGATGGDRGIWGRLGEPLAGVIESTRRGVVCFLGEVGVWWRCRCPGVSRGWRAVVLCTTVADSGQLLPTRYPCGAKHHIVALSGQRILDRR